MAQLQEIDIVFIKLALNYWHLNPDLTKLRPFWRILSNPHEIPNFSFVILKEIHFLKEKALDFVLTRVIFDGIRKVLFRWPVYLIMQAILQITTFFLWEPAF